MSECLRIPIFSLSVKSAAVWREDDNSAPLALAEV